MGKNNSDFTGTQNVHVNKEKASPEKTDQSSATMIVVIFTVAMLVMSAVIIAVSNNVITGEIRSRRAEGLYPESDNLVLEANPASMAPEASQSTVSVLAKSGRAAVEDNENAPDANTPDAAALYVEAVAETADAETTDADTAESGSSFTTTGEATASWYYQSIIPVSALK